MQLQRSPLVNRVSDLINEESISWNVELVDSVFGEDEARLIKGISLSMGLQKYRVVWGGERSGVYSVSSGYRLLLDPQILRSIEEKLFKKIWLINCPPKMRIVLWRFLWCYVLMRACLFGKWIAHSPFYPRCLLDVESVNHVIRYCAYARAAWKDLFLNWPSGVDRLPFYEWLSWLVDSNSATNHTIITITIWGLWNARNKLVHERKNQRVKELITFLKGYGAEHSSLFLGSVGMALADHVVVPWSPSLSLMVKVNVDAGWSHAKRVASSGVVIRDERGLALGPCMRHTNWVLTSFTAEAMPVIHELRLALDMGFYQVIIEN